MNNWWIHVDKDSLQVRKVSSTPEENDQWHLIAIEEELGIKFIDSPHLFREYLVYYDGTQAHFLKKSKTNSLTPFFYTPMLIKEGVENPELSIIQRGDLLYFELKKDLSTYVSTLYATFERQKQLVEFYVCTKNDPNGLLDVLKVDMVKLANEGYVALPFFKKLNRVSLFTRKVFNSYGINIANKQIIDGEKDV